MTIRYITIIVSGSRSYVGRSVWQDSTTARQRT